MNKYPYTTGIVIGLIFAQAYQYAVAPKTKGRDHASPNVEQSPVTCSLAWVVTNQSPVSVSVNFWDCGDTTITLTRDSYTNHFVYIEGPGTYRVYRDGHDFGYEDGFMARYRRIMSTK